LELYTHNYEMLRNSKIEIVSNNRISKSIL